MPNFDHIECLKWANWMMLKDVKRRILNERYFQYRQQLHNIGKSRMLPSTIREVAIEDQQSLPRDSHRDRRNNRCAITSRPRGKLLRYRLSRIVWRDLADHGLISGAIRAKWG